MAPNAKLKQQKSLEMNVKLLKFFGLWSWNDKKNGWRYHARYYFPRVTLCSASLLLISQVIDALNSAGNIDQLSENIYLSIIIVMAIIKNGTLLYRMADVEKLVKVIQNMNQHEHFKDMNQLEIHNQYQKYAQLLTMGFMTMATLTGLNYSLGPLTTHGETHPMPHRSWYPYDFKEAGYYEISFFWLGATALADGSLIGVCDTLFVSCLINAIGHIKLLQHKVEKTRESAVLKVMSLNSDEYQLRRSDKIENLKLLKPPVHEAFLSGGNRRHGRDEESGVRRENEGFLGNRFAGGDLGGGNSGYDSNETGNKRSQFNFEQKSKRHRMFEYDVNYEMERYIGNVVEHHREIMSFVKKIESVFSSVLIYQFMASLAIFCMVAFRTTKTSHIDAKFIALLQLLASAITELFMFCWFSSTLTDESAKVNEAFYLCDWIRASPSFKRSMQIVLIQTNQPICLNAAGFVPVSLELFRIVVKTSYSFYTLLDQLDTPQHHHHMDEVHEAEALRHHAHVL